jgi:hypothetical protein
MCLYKHHGTKKYGKVCGDDKGCDMYYLRNSRHCKIYHSTPTPPSPTPDVESHRFIIQTYLKMCTTESAISAIRLRLRCQSDRYIGTDNQVVIITLGGSFY